MAEQVTNYEEDKKELHEGVIKITRTSKKTKGGDRLGFTSLTVIGDAQGGVGVALSKAPAVLPAIKKASRKAKKLLEKVRVVGEERTIPHTVRVKRGASVILLKPAPAGTGVRAGGAVRAVLEAAGIRNIVAKILGSRNVKGNVYATLEALRQLKNEDHRVVKRHKKIK